MKNENKSQNMGANFGFENTKILFGFRIYGFWSLLSVASPQFFKYSHAWARSAVKCEVKINF
jgi:hypothetical protein